MANRLSRNSGFAFIPGTPEVLARAAGCKTQYALDEGMYWISYRYNNYWSPSTASNYSPPSTYDPETGKRWVDEEYMPRYHDMSLGAQYAFTTRQVCWPAQIYVPGTPSRAISSSVGWGSGARSVNLLKVGYSFQVDLYSNLRSAMIGVSNKYPRYTPAAISSSLRINGDYATPAVNGVDLPDVNITSQRLLVARTKDSVKYIMGGMVLLSVPTNSEDALYISAALYSAYDILEDPKFLPSADAGNDAEMRIESFLDPTPRGVSEFKIEAYGDMYQYGVSVMRIQADGEPAANYFMYGVSPESDLTAYAAVPTLRGTQDAHLAFGEIATAHGFSGFVGAASETHLSRMVGVWPPYTLDATSSNGNDGGTELEGAEGLFPNSKLVSSYLNGGVMRGAGSVRTAGKATYTAMMTGGVRVFQMPVPHGVFYDPRYTDLRDFDAVLTSLELELDSSIMFALFDGVQISGSLDIYLIVNMTMHDMVLAEEAMSFNALLELLINERILVDASSAASSISVKDGVIVPPLDPPKAARMEALQYAVNSITGALSRYQNFGFSQFATSGCSTYAMDGFGVYKLGGSDDDGDPISAAIDFGATDYGTAQGKRVSSVYAGLTTDGEAYIRVSGDSGGEAVYKAISYGNESRARTAKGLVARHWRVRLELTDATFADLDNMEVEIGVSQRRLSRGK